MTSNGKSSVQNWGESYLKGRGEALTASIAKMGRVVVALSGGVDSALLAAAAHMALGDDAVALTVRSPLSTGPDKADADALAAAIGIRHVYLDIDELVDERFASNGAEKCYFCKRMRLEAMARWAAENGYHAILDGSNADDAGDYRPGSRALAEFEAVSSPLLEGGFVKDEIRALARLWGVAVWNKPAGACLASRVAPPGRIERGILDCIERAEAYLRAMLPPDSTVRVRHHGELARIEADDISTSIIAARAREVRDALATIGYRYVTLDLGGYVTGSLNPDNPETKSIR